MSDKFRPWRERKPKRKRLVPLTAGGNKHIVPMTIDKDRRISPLRAGDSCRQDWEDDFYQENFHGGS